MIKTSSIKVKGDFWKSFFFDFFRFKSNRRLNFAGIDLGVRKYAQKSACFWQTGSFRTNYSTINGKPSCKKNTIFCLKRSIFIQLQFKSNQPVSVDAAQEFGTVAVDHPAVLSDMCKKRTIDHLYRNPGKDRISGNNTWKHIRDLPDDKLDGIIRPNTLVRDKEACDHVAKRIQEDDMAEQIQQAFKVKNRLETRARFLRQKEKNIEAEIKGGVSKSYAPVGVTMLK